MKNSVGIVKVINKLGRVVIPKELRKRFGLSDNVEILATDFGLVLRNPEYILVKVNKE